MQIDWVHFTPWTSLGGGILIGLAAAAFALVNGRILGVSGILGGLLRPRGGVAWRIAFFLGLLTAPWVYGVAAGALTVRIDAGWGVVALAGFLVGLGTRYGAGCTSGHGVCGLSRLSLRSLVATAAFMGAGFVVVFIARHVVG